MLYLVILLGYLSTAWAKNEEPVIEMIPPNGELHVLKGREASLMCKITQGEPPPKVTWIKVPGNTPVVGRKEELKFDSVKLEDWGAYRCTASNAAGNKTKEFKIIVYDFVEAAGFVTEMVRLKHKLGSDGFKLIWYDTDVMPGEKGDTHKVAEWMVRAQKASYINPGYAVENKTGDLQIPSLELNHEGFYTALMLDPMDGSTYSYINLIVYVAPTGISIEVGEIEAAREKELVCTCSSVKPASITFEWTFEGNILQTPLVGPPSENEDGTYKVTNTITKTFSREDNGGLLKCTVRHGVDASKDSSKEEKLSILYAPHGNPTVLPTNPIFKVEEDLHLTCDVSGLNKGNPPGEEYVWFKDNVENKTQTGETYRYNPKLVTDTGRYSCLLKNKIGKSPEGYTRVTVEAPPFFEKPENGKSYQPLYNYTDFVVSYLISGSRIKNIKLENSSRVVSKEAFTMNNSTESGKFQYSQNQAHKVTWQWVLENRLLESCANVTFFNGNYTVVAEGLAGNESSASRSSFYIRVKHPAVWGTATRRESSALDDPKTLHCDVCANPEPSRYSWTFMGNALNSTSKTHTIKSVTQNNFGWYICTVTNDINGKLYENRFNITLEEKGSPHTPENFQVSSKTAKTLLVTWDRPFDGGYSLEKYELVVNESVAIDVPSNNLIWRIEKLKPQHTYQLKIRAKNKWKDTARCYSSYAEAREKTPAIPDFKPLEPEITAEALIIKWLYTSEKSQKQSGEDFDRNVTVVVLYKMGNDDFTRHPHKGGIPINKQHEDITGTFDVSAAYVIKYEVYEGQELSLTPPEVSIKPLTPLSPGVIVGAVIGGLLLIIVPVVIIIAVVVIKSRNHKESKSGLGDQSHSRQALDGDAGFGGVTSGDRRGALRNRPAIAPRQPSRNGNGRSPHYQEYNIPPSQARYNAAMEMSEDDQTEARGKTNAHGFKVDTASTELYAEVLPVHLRRNSGNPQEPSMSQNEVLYADLAFEEHRRQREPEWIHGAEETVDYAELDYIRMQQEQSIPSSTDV